MQKLFLFSIFLFLLTAYGGPADVHAGRRPDSIQQEVSSQQQKIKMMQSEIEDHKKRVKHSRTKEINLLAQLEVIDLAIIAGQKRLKDLKVQVVEQEKLINLKIEELSRVEDEKEEVKEHIKKRLAAFYRLGDIGLMNVTFAAGNLPDLLNFKEYFHHLIKYDQQVVNDYREKIERLIAIGLALEEGKGKLLKVIVTVKKEENQLATVRKERMVLLAKVNTEKQLYERAIEEMEEASSRLTERLAKLREKLMASHQGQKHYYSSPKKRRPGSATGFSAMRGRLIPPVRGSVTTYFGKNSKGKFGITTYADGIDIKALSGTEIYAIFNGKVVYAGQLKGYGNLIIIDHGEQYYSLISRAAEIYKKEGDIITTGEVIGIMGDQGGLLGEGLHFEIRYGTEPENPLKWVNKRLLKINTTHATNHAKKRARTNN
ncbi:MAG: peptidoglycan DD-metalloendopeptidase family protein [Thermodesulfobacteriota bacterium]